MRKHKTIEELLQRLSLEERGWTVEDHWDGDLHAVGIACRRVPRRLVYVSTFGKESGRYAYECEEATGGDSTQYNVAAKATDVSYDDLLTAIEAHLRV